MPDHLFAELLSSDVNVRDKHLVNRYRRLERHMHGIRDAMSNIAHGRRPLSDLDDEIRYLADCLAQIRRELEAAVKHRK